MATITVIAPELTGESSLTLYLHAEADGTLTNTGGDALSETASSNGMFTATVAESISGDHYAVIKDAVGVVRYGFLPDGETTIQEGDSGDLIADTLDTASYCLTVLSGTISNASEAIETYQLTINGSSYTVQTSGLDTDGNRSGQTLSKA